MIPRCELCGTAIPALDRETFVAQGYRELTWEGRGPHLFCPAHSLDEVLLWTAEAFVCDRALLRGLRARQGVQA